MLAMQRNQVPQKTEAGRREIESRELKLAWQLRALLIETNGERSVADLVHVYKTHEATVAALEELRSLGLIEIPDEKVDLPRLIAGDGVTPLQQARQLLNDTAVGSLGVLGGIAAFRFTLKIERCYSVDEVRALFPDYRKLVTKSKGADYVESVLARVEKLLAQSQASTSNPN
jgi:hypothetical protein